MEQILLYSNIILWVSILFIFACLFFIFRQFGEVYLKSSSAITRDGISIGKPIPRFAATSFRNSNKLTNSLINRPSLLVFISPTCQACKDLVEVWDSANRKYGSGFNLLLIGHGTKDEFQKMQKKYTLNSDILLDETGEMVNRFKVRVSPFAFMVDQRGEVKSKGVCNGLEHIEQYLTSVESNDYQDVNSKKTS